MATISLRMPEDVCTGSPWTWRRCEIV